MFHESLRLKNLRFAAPALVLCIVLSSCAESQSINEPPVNEPPVGQPPTPPPPPPAGQVFASDWSTGTGNVLNAVTDGGRWPILACGTTWPNVLTVVAGAPVGFSETPNVLRVQQRGPTDCGMLQVNNVVPASTTHWGRFYVRNDENGNSGDHPTGYNNAGGGSAIQSVPWARESQDPAGTWHMSVGGDATYPFRKFHGPTLQNGVWYRFEWEKRYYSATTYRWFIRVYNAAGTLLHTENDFRQQDYPGAGTHTLASYYTLDGGTRTFAIRDPALARHFGIGHEGTTGAVTLGYWYYGKFGMSTEGWLGR